jgi:NAD(P)-dependent dehydrogenase (short-subunit alcohol dehydrogenase family)
MMRLKDKVAVITGAGRGIGRAVALGYAREGAHVAVLARTESEIQETAALVEASGQEAVAIKCDVTVENQVKAAISGVQARWERIDILVNNAGIGGFRPVWGTSKRSFESILAVNLTGTFFCTKHVWRPMRAVGGGVILNISSLGGLRGYALLSAYCASKWGQIGFTLACAEEGKPDNIRVNAIAPGKVDTRFRAQIEEDKNRMLEPEDHVGACIFLASDEARYITGHVIPLEWFETNNLEG